MTDIEVVKKMPWWQKAYCVAFGLMFLHSSYGLIYQLRTLTLTHYPTHYPIQTLWMGMIAYSFGPILYSFLFLIGLVHWRKNEPL